LRISSLAPRCANGAALEVGAGGGQKRTQHGRFTSAPLPSSKPVFVGVYAESEVLGLYRFGCS
jgi:hypothetical protein